MRATRACRGFTFIETTVVVAVLGLLLAAVGKVFAASGGLSAESRAMLRAAEENSRGLACVADMLRGASWDSLAGFGAQGTSTEPTFQTVVGMDGAGPILDLPCALCWRERKGPGGPGEIVVTQDGRTTPLVARVAAGGFLVTLQGYTVKVRLTTIYTTSQRKTAVVTNELSFCLRN